VIGIKQNEKYDARKIAERYRDHSLYVAFAPADKPKIALALIVENGGFGAQAAAPIARQVFDYYLMGKLPKDQDLPFPNRQDEEEMRDVPESMEPELAPGESGGGSVEMARSAAAAAAAATTPASGPIAGRSAPASPPPAAARPAPAPAPRAAPRSTPMAAPKSPPPPAAPRPPPAVPPAKSGPSSAAPPRTERPSTPPATPSTVAVAPARGEAR